MNKPIVYPNSGALRIRSRGRLPHWEVSEAYYFITYHLADALPAAVLQRLEDERLALLRTLSGGRQPSPSEQSELSYRLHLRLDAELDRGLGACQLRDSRAARITADALCFHNGRLYDLIAWTVMPNHLHVVIFLYDGGTLDRVLHGWKSFTAHAINDVLGRTGTLWQREYFDRVARDERELHSEIQYVLDNPAKAGLQNWPWIGTIADRTSCVTGKPS